MILPGSNSVIVTDSHTRMALAVIRELGLAGYAVTALTRASKPSFAQNSRYVRKRIVLPDEQYIDALLALGLDEGRACEDRPVLLAAGAYTMQLAAAQRNAFSQAFRFLIPEADALHAAGDKPSVMQAARTLGLLTPEEYPPEAPRFPCVIKYLNGEALNLPAKARYAIVREAAVYESTLSAMRAKGAVFVLQYIPGRAFGVSCVLNEKSEPLSVFCHKRVREYPVSGGPACCAESIWDAPLVEKALALLKAMRLTGFAMVEFKGDLDCPYVLEINPRIWGTYPLSRLSGAGMAVAYVKAALGETAASAPTCRYKTGVRMQYLANDLMHFVSRLREGHLAGAVLTDFLSPRVKGGVFDWDDWTGSAAYLRALFHKRNRGAL